MKTGRLLKFVRPLADIQAYIYRDGAKVHGTIYAVTPGTNELQVADELFGTSERQVEQAVRAWVDERYPKGDS